MDAPLVSLLLFIVDALCCCDVSQRTLRGRSPLEHWHFCLPNVHIGIKKGLLVFGFMVNRLPFWQLFDTL